MQEKNWWLYAKKADYQVLADRFNINWILARIMSNRGIDEGEMEDFIHPGKNVLNDPHLLKDSEVACKIICNGINDGKKIRIIGDYDIDGICSTHILKQSLMALDANVDYYLPKRIEDGYGMNESMADSAYRDGVDIIITCDNGISAFAAIEKAKQYGISVVVTDHHEVPKDENGTDLLVAADAVVDPKRSDCHYPFKEICGTVVAWKICFLLFEAFGKDSSFVMDLIEFAAFATVGDIMKLHNENRAIVSMGLQKMSHSKNIGLAMLIEACNLNGIKLNAHHLGFVLGPCLNAGGRLADASIGVELFESKDRQEAYEIAQKLRQMNEGRKQMTYDGLQAAVDTVEQNGYEKQNVIVVYVPNIHESLCGIIAGRLKEKYYRPCFMLTDGESFVKGSGRSIEGYSMTERISECEDILEMYGGHSMAAGLSIQKNNIDILRNRLNDNCCLTDSQLVKKTMIDVSLPLSEITTSIVQQIELLEPYGNGNEKPIFGAKDIFVWKMQRIGKNSEYLKLTLKENQTIIEGLFFGDADAMEYEIKAGDAIDIVYYPKINEYRGNITLQVEIKDYRKKYEKENG